VTGRSFPFARPVAESLPDDLTMIVSNGAVVKRKTGATLMSRLLPREVARYILTETGPFRDSAALIFDRPRAGQIVSDAMDWEQPNRRGYFERNRERIDTSTTFDQALTEDPIQVMFNGAVEPMRELRRQLLALPRAGLFEVALTEYEHRDFSLVDVLASGCTKGTTLAAWAERQGIGRSDIMAVGDNFNDLEMLEFAGRPVVMGNAVAELKDRGWPVTGTNDEGGLAEAIWRYVLG
jgi:HAD superfamily hydrolase (TIGR01484 family)